MTSLIAQQIRPEVISRAQQSLGISDSSLYSIVADLVKSHSSRNGVLVDVGCGTGQLWPFLRAHFARYIGVDAVRYPDFTNSAEFHLVDLDQSVSTLPNGSADVVTAIETIEHVENPRAFMRELVRLVKPGGLVIVTTPNQLSLLSLLSLIFKKRFALFQDVHYPAHLTALLEVDLMRIAKECELTECSIKYDLKGRVILTPWHFPRALTRIFPRALSDHVILAGIKPVATSPIQRPI